ncbi:MAG: hypothetical protein LBK92_04265 [Endomicrobium sp.]|jgi:hypothetical protein|nr:hypothetical protein [Endomicrobium sp.]
MRGEERVVEIECQVCKGNGYLCECESDGIVNRCPNSEECDYCGSQRRDKYKYVWQLLRRARKCGGSRACGGRGF